MRDTIRGEDHAVAAARLDGHWLTLDNRRMAMIEDAQVRNYRPTFVIDQSGIMQYVDAPLLAGLRGRGSCPGESCSGGSRSLGNAECRARLDLAFQLKRFPFAIG